MCLLEVLEFFYFENRIRIAQFIDNTLVKH